MRIRNLETLFDAQFYKRQILSHTPCSADLLRHYLSFGWQKGWDPHPLFRTSFYLKFNQDVMTLGCSPLIHYAVYGWREGRVPHALFSPQYYKSQLTLRELKALKDPLSHYLTTGWKKGISPTPYFDVSYYYSQYPELKKRTCDPLRHYLEYGWRMGLSPCPEFDHSFYLEQFPEVMNRESPLENFILNGAKQLVRPSPEISAQLFQVLRTELGEVEFDLPNFRPVKRSLKAKDRRLGSKILFMHIPKTAGVSLREIIKTQYPKRSFLYLKAGVAASKETVQNLLRELKAKEIRLHGVFGHFPFGIHESMDLPVTYTAFLRNPEDRLISLYKYHAETPESDLYTPISEGMSFYDFIKSGVSLQTNNSMTRFIAGLPIEFDVTESLPKNFKNEDALIFSEDYLDRALENIRKMFFFIGIYENFEKSVRALGRQLGWDSVAIPKYNVVPSSKKIKIDVKTRTLIYELNDLDRKLYKKFSRAAFENPDFSLLQATHESGYRI